MSRELSDWLSSYMLYTDGTEPPDLYREWMGVATIASCLQRRCKIEIGFERFYPNFYIVLCGPSGRCRKGTAIGPAVGLMRESGGIKLVADSITREQLIGAMKEASDNDIGPDGEVILHASLTTISKELGVFMGDYDEKFIWALTDWYDCADTWKYETKHQGKFEISGVWFNFIAATTPTVLQEKFGSVAVMGGLTSRMIIVNEFNRARTSPRHSLSAEQLIFQQKLLTDMERLKAIRGTFDISPIDDIYADWYVGQSEAPPFDDERFDGYFNRRQVHLLKLAMIMSASESDELVVTPSHFARALDLLEDTEKKMFYAFRGVGESELIKATDRVIQTIAVMKEVTYDVLLRKHYRFISNRTLDDVLTQLELMKKIRRVTNPQERKQTIVWLEE